MKPLNLIFTLLILLFSSFIDAKNAPNFVISSTQDIRNLSDLKGQVVYLDFWASWCKPCRKSFPWMNAIQKKYQHRNFTIVTINLDKKKALMDRFLLKYPATFKIVHDPKATIAALYHLQSMPSSYIIDFDGNIVFSHIGFFEKKQIQYEKEIESVLNGEKESP